MTSITLSRAFVGTVAVLIACGATACGKAGGPVDTPAASQPGNGGLTNTQIVEDLRARSYDATETIPGVVVNLPDVYLFAFGRSDIGPEGKTKLRELATYLNRPELSPRRLTVEGHTDSVGGEVANLTLAERRAEAVRGELLSAKVAPGRVSVRAYGETKPVAPNTRPDGSDNADGRARNRRVEILIGSLTSP
jgi:outer membrane protein OmpA-like peptidoglycan-associated protein